MWPVPMKDWWICRFFSFPVRGHVCQVACEEWRQCTTWRLYPASWLWQIKSSRGDEDVRYDDLTVVFLCQHTPNTDTVGSQNDARNQIYIYFSSQSALSNHYCRFVFPPPARLMRMSPGLTGFLAFRLKRCIPLKMSFSGGSLFWPITEASARKRANVCIQTGCSVVCSEEVHVQHWLLWTMAARYYEIRDVDV